MQTGGLRTKGITKTSSESQPLITVVTVVYNAESTLEQTILSVINQTYDNVEYILVDGASTDGTLDIIKKYEDKIDYWISEPDKGIYDAMNKGIDLASGDFLVFLGADDLLFDAYVFQNISNRMVNREAVYYGNVFFREKQVIYGFSFNKLKLCCRNICHQSIFYPKRIYKKLNYNLRFKIYADWEYNIRVWNQCQFIYLAVVVTNFYDCGSSGQGDFEFCRKKKDLIIQNFGKHVYWLYLCLKPFSRYIYFLRDLILSKR